MAQPLPWLRVGRNKSQNSATSKESRTCADSKSVFPYSKESGFAPANVRRIALLWLTVVVAAASLDGRGRQILRTKPLARGEMASSSPSVLANLASSSIPAMLESEKEARAAGEGGRRGRKDGSEGGRGRRGEGIGGGYL